MAKLYDITQFEYKREITTRFLYPFYSLNKLTGGAEVGNLNILFSKTNQGKSELSMQFMTQWIKDNHKVCAMLGEHSMRKAQSLLYKKITMYNPDTWITKKLENNGKYTGISETFISEDDEAKAKEFYKGNLFLYDTRNGFKLETILDAFEEGFKMGCDVFLLDNGMMLDLETSNELIEQRDNTEKLRQWAKHHNVVVFLVLHARKVEIGRIRLTEYDILGSSNIANKGTSVFYILRTDTLNKSTKEYKDFGEVLRLNNIDIEECEAVIEVVKEKNGRHGFVPLKWFESTKTYREVYKPNDKSNSDEKPILHNPKPLITEIKDFNEELPF